MSAIVLRSAAQPCDYGDMTRLRDAMTVVCLCAVAGVIVACGPMAAPVESLRIVRESVVAGNVFPPFDRTLGGSDAASLRHELLALPPKTVEKFCPNDSGMRYRLSFSGGAPVTAVLEAGGCRYVHLSTSDIRETNEDFWAHLAGALGFYTRGYDLFPTEIPHAAPPR